MASYELSYLQSRKSKFLKITGLLTVFLLVVAGGSAFDIKDSDFSVYTGDSADTISMFFHVAQNGPVEVRNADLEMNNNNISGVDAINGVLFSDLATESYVDSQTSSTSACPSGYVKVPGSDKHGTEDFCVMKYEAKNDGSGNPVSQASGNPWVNIDQFDARRECRSLGSDYHLITESEWMTIADNAMRQGSNWADGDIGSKASNGGGMYIGNVAPPSSHSHLGVNGPDPDDATSPGSTEEEVRTLQLSNGNEVWDLSGNVWEWTNGYMTTDGVPEPGNNGWTEYTGVTNFQEMSDEKPLNPAWSAENGIGRIYLDQSPYTNNNQVTSNIHAVRRGGYWLRGADAGALSVSLNVAPSCTRSYIGFRCAADL